VVETSRVTDAASLRDDPGLGFLQHRDAMSLLSVACLPMVLVRSAESVARTAEDPGTRLRGIPFTRARG
jgi:hypothetical protein